MILKRPVQLRESFSFEGCYRRLCAILVGLWRLCCLPMPSLQQRIWVGPERVREGGVAPVDAGDCEGVLFANELVGSLLSFTGEIAIVEMVTVKALVGSAVRAAEDGEEEAR